MKQSGQTKDQMNADWGGKRTPKMRLFGKAFGVNEKPRMTDRLCRSTRLKCLLLLPLGPDRVHTATSHGARQPYTAFLLYMILKKTQEEKQKEYCLK